MTENDWQPRLRVRWDDVAQLYRWADDGQPLTADECETLELDPTGRWRAGWTNGQDQ